MTDTPTLSAGDSLRSLAAHLDEHPDLTPSAMTWRVYVGSAETYAALVRQLGGTINNPVVKTADESYVAAHRTFGAITLEVFMSRAQACERKQVGTRTVERPVMQQVGVETVDEPIYEWDCAPILAPWSHEAELAARADDALDAQRAERAEDSDDAYSATGR